MAPASAQGPFCLTPDDRRHELVLCPVCRRVSMPCIISAASLLPIALLYERNIRRGHDFVRADPREDGAMAGLYVIWCRDRRFHRPTGGSAGQITWDNQLLRFDSVNGERVAVIESRFKAPMDTTIDARKLAQAEASASPPPGMPTPPPGFSPPPGASGFSLPPGFNPVVHLQGTTTGSITSWVEVSTGRLVKASGTSSSTISESVQGVPSPAAGAFGLGAGDSQMAETQSIVVSSVPE